MARRTKDEAAATRESILDAAITLFLDHGVSRTSLDQIAKQANCTRGAVYHHFTNKAEVLKELLDSVRLPTEELFDQFEEYEKDQPLKAIQLWCRQAFEILLSSERCQRIHTIFYYRCEFVDETNPARVSELQMIRDCHDRFTAQFQRASELGQLRPDLSPEDVSYLLHSYCVGIYSNTLKEPWCQMIKLHVDPMLDVFFKGIQP